MPEGDGQVGRRQDQKRVIGEQAEETAREVFVLATPHGLGLQHRGSSGRRAGGVAWARLANNLTRAMAWAVHRCNAVAPRRVTTAAAAGASTARRGRRASRRLR